MRSTAAAVLRASYACDDTCAAVLIGTPQRSGSAAPQSRKSTLRVQCTLALDLHEFADVEHDPSIRVWLSQNLSRGVARHVFDEQSVQLSRDGSDRARCSARLDLAYDVPYATQDALTALCGASLNLDAFTRVDNKHHQRSYNEAGSVRIPLGALLQQQQQQRTSAIIDAQLVVAGLVGQVEPEYTVKGVVRISDYSLTLNDRAVAPLQSLGTLRQICDTIGGDNQSLLAYIAQTRQLYASHIRPTYACLRRINCFELTTRTGNKLPAAAYVMTVPPLPVKPDYYAHALGVVLRRHSLDVAHWVNDRLDALTEATVLGEVLTLLISYTPYFGDECLTQRDGSKRPIATPMESFRFLRTRLSGDCEDSALEVREVFFLFAISCGASSTCDDSHTKADIWQLLRRI